MLRRFALFAFKFVFSAAKKEKIHGNGARSGDRIQKGVIWRETWSGVIEALLLIVKNGALNSFKAA